MDTHEVLAKLEDLLEEERMAIRSLHGERVYAIACEKLELMKQLDAARTLGSTEYAARVKEVVRRLRHNSVLLVHAKSILAEAVRVKKARIAAAAPRTAVRIENKGPERRFSAVG